MSERERKTHTHTRTHAHTHVHTHAHAHTRTHARTHHARAHTHTHTNTHTHTHTHTHTQTCMFEYVRAYTHAFMPCVHTSSVRTPTHMGADLHPCVSNNHHLALVSRPQLHSQPMWPKCRCSQPLYHTFESRLKPARVFPNAINGRSEALSRVGAGEPIPPPPLIECRAEDSINKFPMDFQMTPFESNRGYPERLIDFPPKDARLNRWRHT